MTDRPLNLVETELFKWAGCPVVLVAREAGKPDRVLVATYTAEESKELCAAAMAILRRRPQPDYRAIAMHAGFRLNHVIEGDDDGGYHYWYTPGYNVDDDHYREGDVVTSEDDAWRDCCERNNLL